MSEELKPEAEALAEQEAAIAAEIRRRGRTDFMVFVRNLILKGAHGPGKFDDIMADFQREAFEDLAPVLEALQRGDMPYARRWWIERTKKASKDTDISICLIWLMAYTERPFLAQVCAANSDQAGIIEDRAREVLHYNTWLNDEIEVIQKCIRNLDQPEIVRCQIEATGTAGAAQGPTPDILVLNELTHVDKWAVMEAHMNNADGVPRGVVIVSTNAGIKGTLAEVWRKNAENSDRWTMKLWQKKSPWLSDDDMADAKKRDPIGSEFARLWLGLWVSGKGDAVAEHVIEAAFTPAPGEPPRGPILGAQPGWQYVGAYDLGITHDHAGAVVVGVNRQLLKARVAILKGFKPEIKGGGDKLEVDLIAVEKFVEVMGKKFRCTDIGYDPAAGGSFMAQRLIKKGLPMRQHTFSQANMTDMAKAFVVLMNGGKLECYDDEERRLRRDFGKFSIEHRPPSDYKLTAISDEFGHADVGTALIICLPKVVELLGGWSALLPDDDIAFSLGDEADLTDEEMGDLPDEFAELFTMYSEFEDDDDLSRYEL